MLRQTCGDRAVRIVLPFSKWATEPTTFALFHRTDIVRAAVEGRLPRGIGVERLRDAPAEWGKQFEALGLNPNQGQV